MKMTKKKVFVVALAVCLIAVISIGTLAWFSDSDTVTNKFMVADSNNDDNVFDVDLWETDPDTDEKTDSGVEYKDIFPGKTVDKNPTVENTCDYTQWIKVVVTVSNHDTWAEATDYDKPLLSMANIDFSKWLISASDVVVSTDGKTGTYTFYYADKLQQGGKAELFNKVTVPTGLTDEMINAILAGSEDTEVLSMNIVAYAVQADNTGDNAREAFALVESEQTL